MIRQAKGFFGAAAFAVLGWVVLKLMVHKTNRTRVLLLSPDGEKILLLRNFFGLQDWELPGGGIHKGESFEEAAARELEEETGVKLKPNRLKQIGTTHRNSRGSTYTLHVFEATAKDEAIKSARGEVLELSWHAIEDLPDNRDSLVDESLRTRV